MTIVYVNNMSETFTPTQSGALSTHIWEVSRIAEERGQAAWIITRDCDAEHYPAKHLIRLHFPPEPSGGPRLFVARARRKLSGWPDLNQLGFARRIARTIRDRRLDRYPLHLANNPELVVYLRRLFPHARIVHHFHNQVAGSPRFRDGYAEAVDATICVSDFNAHWIRDQYGLDPSTVHRIYNAVNSEQFFPADAEPDGPVVFNFVGRTGREKGVDLLLDAALRLAEHRRDFAVQIVGANNFDRFVADAYQAELSARCDRLTGLGIEVRRPGHVDRHRLPEFFRRAHVHVVPSRWEEPFGMTASEGMASGLATVVARSGGLPEVVGNAGLMFDIEAVDQLADRMTTLLDEPAQRREFGQTARRRVVEHFSWSRYYDQLRAVMLDEPVPSHPHPEPQHAAPTADPALAV
ncbi:MAG: glycosyltransferase family 4 protein [Planctomycetota bacterium]